MYTYTRAPSLVATTTQSADIMLGALHDAARTTISADEIRLDRLVFSLLDMDDAEAKQIEALTGEPGGSPLREPRRFHETLTLAIRELRLTWFFCQSDQGPYHRAICPSAYDERRGEHHPAEMAEWRARFRAHAPERQMVVATIIWLYRSGPDSIWLRRVPCNWRAIDALRYMGDAGCLSIWIRLITRYPGW
ncbi:MULTISPECIES: hypothetical protein [Burkholderia]|uniref:hypothetical protein n=1 Tax=Burkholderia TaxID=32008 RepID=UPI0006912CC7|nr:MULTISPECIES: hypothetical protein [Burkholderia]